MHWERKTDYYYFQTHYENKQFLDIAWYSICSNTVHTIISFKSTKLILTTAEGFFISFGSDFCQEE